MQSLNRKDSIAHCLLHLHGKKPAGSKMKKERFTDGLQHIQTGDTHQPEKEAGEKMVTLHRIEKNNGKILDAVTIMESGTHIAPTIYLADFYDFFSHGMSLEEVTLKIIDLTQKGRWRKQNFRMPDLRITKEPGAISATN